MANRYWVGGTGEWDSESTFNWSAASGSFPGASVPAAGDNIIFDANSGTGDYTVSFYGASWTLRTGDITMSNPTGGVLTFSGHGTNLFIGGNLTIASDVVTTGLIAYFTNQVPVTVTTNGVFMLYFVVDSPSTVTLGSALNVSNWAVYRGTFNSGDFDITAIQFYGGNYGSYNRTVSLGSSTVTITGHGNTAWQCQFALSYLTFNSGTSTINFTSADSPYPEFHGGGKSYATVNVSGLGLVICENNTFSTLANTVSPATVRFVPSSTQTFTNFNLNGTAGNLVTINSSTTGQAATLSKASGTVSCDYVRIQDLTASGGATWNAGENSTNVSGNSGWIFADPIANNTGNFFRMFQFVIAENFVTYNLAFLCILVNTSVS